MRSLGHRAQLTLLLGAVFLPCAVLTVLSLRVTNQDRELRASRRMEERKRLLAQAGERLRAALDRIRAGEIRTDLEPGQSYRHAETVFVGWSDGDQFVLPWEPERDRAGRRSRELISEPLFESALRACESAAARPGNRDDCYRRLEAAPGHPFQTAYVKWRHAEALQAAGQYSRAAAIMQALLDAGPELADPDGIPLRLHSIQSLLHSGLISPRVFASLDSALSARPWLSPMALLIVSEAVRVLARGAIDPEEMLAAEALYRKSAAKVRLVDQAQLLQEEFPRLQPALKSSWVPFGEGIWLVGSAGTPDRNTPIFVVHGQGVLDIAGIPGAVRLAGTRDSAGEFIGSSFPGLKLVLASGGPADTGAQGGIERYLFPLALLLAMLVTVFAAYLLWRDLKREMAVSDLRTQFVASVSHELKTPLTAIRMFAETLQMGRCPDARVQADYLGTIVNECERLSRLVDGVLLFSKAGEGRKTFRFRPVQLAEAVFAAARAMEYSLSQHGFRLHLEVREDIPDVAADRDAIEQAVLNLLSNAMKFSGDARDVGLALYMENVEAVIRVSDRGIGIAPEEQARIFEKFYRVSTPQSQVIPGTGLGLALVAQIAHAHSGRVTVESELGKGSTFYLRLPAPPCATRKEQ
jgi:signal transduction histidine kinase